MLPITINIAASKKIIRSLHLSESHGFFSKDGQWTEFSAGKANSNGESALDPNFTSKRKVPNGSDPLDNR
ncbi:hypothetical protein SUGI_0083930 [Cryptomeria japonica]|nr:hypothetical protein SUGI_0083930 [Cryptomeria japonica]